MPQRGLTASGTRFGQQRQPRNEGIENANGLVRIGNDRNPVAQRRSGVQKEHEEVMAQFEVGGRWWVLVIRSIKSKAERDAK